MLIIPGDRNFYEFSDGILYISVGQIVPEVLYILYQFHFLRPLAHRASDLRLPTGPWLISLASGIGPVVNVADCNGVIKSMEVYLSKHQDPLSILKYHN